MNKYPSLDFGNNTPRQRGSEAFARGLMRAEITDRQFFTIMNSNAKSTDFMIRELGNHRTEACREWVNGWDDAASASRPSNVQENIATIGATAFFGIDRRNAKGDAKKE